MAEKERKKKNPQSPVINHNLQLASMSEMSAVVHSIHFSLIVSKIRSFHAIGTLIPFCSSRCLCQSGTEHVHQSQALLTAAEEVSTVRRCSHVCMETHTHTRSKYTPPHYRHFGHL